MFGGTLINKHLESDRYIELNCSTPFEVELMRDMRNALHISYIDKKYNKQNRLERKKLKKEEKERNKAKIKAKSKNIDKSGF